MMSWYFSVNWEPQFSITSMYSSGFQILIHTLSTVPVQSKLRFPNCLHANGRLFVDSSTINYCISDVYFFSPQFVPYLNRLLRMSWYVGTPFLFTVIRIPNFAILLLFNNNQNTVELAVRFETRAFYKVRNGEKDDSRRQHRQAGLKR